MNPFYRNWIAERPKVLLKRYSRNIVSIKPLHSKSGDERHGILHGTIPRTDQRNLGPNSAVAIYNVDMPAARKQYCEIIESIVERLGEREQTLIRERYMKQDDVFDYKVYNHILEPPVSKDTYTKIRTRAFYKLALALADRGC